MIYHLARCLARTRCAGNVGRRGSAAALDHEGEAALNEGSQNSGLSRSRCAGTAGAAIAARS